MGDPRPELRATSLVLAARIRAASGSDRHLELLAEEVADKSLAARIRAASDSDRHLPLRLSSPRSIHRETTQR